MRKLKNLNYIEVFVNEIKEDIPEKSEHIEISSFDISSIQSLEKIYLLFLDLFGYITRENFKFEFSISIDMFSDNDSDKIAENLIDLIEVEKLIKDRFFDKDSGLRRMLDKQIDLLIENQYNEINLD